tara:strand:- start:1772 stop:2461 length:690 start_codon:yes stop_codon:yes gene_type:complete
MQSLRNVHIDYDWSGLIGLKYGVAHKWLLGHSKDATLDSVDTPGYDFRPDAKAPVEYGDGNQIRMHQWDRQADTAGKLHKNFTEDVTRMEREWIGSAPQYNEGHNTKPGSDKTAFDKGGFDKEFFEEQLGMDIVEVSSSRQMPGQFLTLHSDLFHGIIKRHPEWEGSLYRANIFMEDRKPGHFLEVDYKAVPDWKAGDGFIWDSTITHQSCNGGNEPKFTLQITGLLKK